MTNNSSDTCSSDLTIVLVGRTGNGKSATANSILGSRIFNSGNRARAITLQCQVGSTTFSNGRKLTVIDTPGLFDFSVGPKSADNEIVKCIGLAKDGINAFVLVYKATTRFTREELATFETLQNFFGKDSMNYLIVLFTGGDNLEDEGETLDDYLNECPESLKQILQSCDQRRLLFNNKTEEEEKKTQQVKELFEMVEGIKLKNNGKPYSNEIFLEFQRTVEMNKSKEDTEEGKAFYAHQINKITEMVEKKLSYSMKMLEMKLEIEQKERTMEQKLFEQQIEQLTMNMMRDSRNAEERTQLLFENKELQDKIARLQELRKHEMEVGNLKSDIQRLNGQLESTNSKSFCCIQ